LFVSANLPSFLLSTRDRINLSDSVIPSASRPSTLFDDGPMMVHHLLMMFHHFCDDVPLSFPVVIVSIYLTASFHQHQDHQHCLMMVHSVCSHDTLVSHLQGHTQS